MLTGFGYKGTIAGWRKFGRRELLKAAFSGMSPRVDAQRLQRRLDKAAAQDRARAAIGGGSVA